MTQAKQRFGLPADAPGRRGYAAGQSGGLEADRRHIMELLQKKTKILNNSLNTLQGVIKNNSIKLILLKKYREFIPQGIVFLAFLFIYIIIKNIVLSFFFLILSPFFFYIFYSLFF